MKNKASIYLIIVICLFVGLLHFLIGPDYQGPFRKFMRGYLIDIIIPFNLYLLLQVSLRKSLAVNKSRIVAALFIFIFGTLVEILQSNEIDFLGSTYDPLDILMCGLGVGFGLTFDFIILNQLEK